VEREFQKALKLNPSDAFAHLFRSNSYLSPLGRHEEAIAEMKKAIELDPFSTRIQSFNRFLDVPISGRAGTMTH